MTGRVSTGLLSIGLPSTGLPSTGRVSIRIRQISMPLVMRTSSTMLPSKQQCNLPSLPSTLSPLLRLLCNEIQNPKDFDLVSTVLFQIFPHPTPTRPHRCFKYTRSCLFALFVLLRARRFETCEYGMVKECDLAVVVMPMIAHSN